jgi:hypothetical protein
MLISFYFMEEVMEAQSTAMAQRGARTATWSIIDELFTQAIAGASCETIFNSSHGHQPAPGGAGGGHLDFDQ